MRIHAVKVSSGEERTFRFLSHRLRLEIASEKSLVQLRRSRANKGGLLLQRNGRNLIVTNHGIGEPVVIGDQPTAIGVPHVWLEAQELWIGEKFLLGWSTEPRDKDDSQAQLAVWIATLLALLLICVFMIWSIGGAGGDVTGSAGVASAAGSTLTPGAPPAPSPTLQPLPHGSPTQTRIDPRDSPVGPPAFAASIAEATRSAQAMAQATALAPCVIAPVEAAEWDADLVMVVEPACVRSGESYWRLVEARWLDDAKLDGYHHLFVDVVDENGNRLYGDSFVMRWQTGECRRFIRGAVTPIDHGEHCPMFARAGSYDVAVDGLPGEVVKGLGLGGVQPDSVRGWRYLTSFYLLFQRVNFPTD